MHLSRRRSGKRPRSGRLWADLARAPRFGKPRLVPSFFKIGFLDWVVSRRVLVTRTRMMLFFYCAADLRRSIVRDPPGGS